MAPRNHSRLLYFFTTRAELAQAQSRHALNPTPMHIGRHRVGVELVWLTDADYPVTEHEQGVAILRPGERAPVSELVRLTVTIDDAQPWTRWAAHHHVRRSVRKAVESESLGSDSRWWVTSRTVPAQAWVAEHDLGAGLDRRISPVREGA